MGVNSLGGVWFHAFHLHTVERSRGVGLRCLSFKYKLWNHINNGLPRDVFERETIMTKQIATQPPFSLDSVGLERVRCFHFHSIYVAQEQT